MAFKLIPQVPVVVGSSPDSVTTAGVNGDGRLDILTAYQTSNAVSVRLANTSPFRLFSLA